MIATSEGAKLYLIYPAFLIRKAESIDALGMQWLRHRSNEWSCQMGVPPPQIEWSHGTRLDEQNPGCQSPARRWANIERAGHRINLFPRAAQELDQQALLFVAAHLFCELNANEPEWIYDLRACDLLGEIEIPLVDETAVAIALNPRARLRALEFKSGQRAVELGDRLAGERAEETSDQPFLFQSPLFRTNPY